MGILNKKLALKKSPTKRLGNYTFWSKTRKYRWQIIVGGLIIVEILVQYFYPRHYTLPFARYGQEFYGFKHRNILEIEEQERFSNAKIRLNTRNNSNEVKISTIGADLINSNTFNQLSEYPSTLRFVPLSIFWQFPHVDSFSVKFSNSLLDEFIGKFAKNNHIDVENATVAIKDGNITATEAKAGSDVDISTFRNIILHKKYNIDETTVIEVPEKTIVPKSTSSDLMEIREKAEIAIAKEIRISIEGRDDVFIPTREQIASWLEIVDNEGKAKLQIKADKVANYVVEMDKKVAKTAGETVITIIDGRESERYESEAGKQINKDNFVKQVNDVLFTPGRYKYIQAELMDVAPNVKKVYRYSNSQSGLESKLQEIGSRYNVRISIKQLDGAGWQASYRGSESTPSASTYKLYIAIKLLKEIHSGNIKWSDSILDTNVAGCFDRMILYSTNPCAEAWINQFGRTDLNNFLYSRGISNVTTFTANDAVRTSSDDLLRAVEGIYNGNLVDEQNRHKMLDMMRRQIWRKGIPSGTAGWTSNKVGFLWNYVHDVGVVHHPHGTYILAIMTKYANYGIIAKITTELENFMYK